AITTTGTGTFGTLSVNSESFTDLTGTGLTNNSGSLETTLGTAIDTSEITDATILENDLNATNDAGEAEDGYILSYDHATGGFTWIDSGSAGVNYWTDGGDVTYLTSTTDSFAIGGSSLTDSSFSIDLADGSSNTLFNFGDT